MRDDSEGAEDLSLAPHNMANSTSKRDGNMSMQSFGEQTGAGDAMLVRADFACMYLCRLHA